MNADGDRCGPVWRVHEQAVFHWRQWGDEWTVFDEGSGQTHSMDTTTALVIVTLETAPSTARELAAALCQSPDAESRSAFERTLAPILSRLSEVDLIEPADR